MRWTPGARREPGMKTIAAALCLAAALAACTINNSPSSPHGCNSDSSISCANAANGYSCSGDSQPTDGDSNLDCGPGTADESNTDFCCITLGQSTCAPDSSVQGCQGNSYGFSCTGSDTPDDADSSLNCSTGTPGNGATLYCCS
jgi:hypothetical protein